MHYLQDEPTNRKERKERKENISGFLCALYVLCGSIFPVNRTEIALR